ncbi:hypothetical protein B7494_g735 [Chlorociboria aeruginascens]|nr:hypothetical protein B7494_g735 [Chlorociboria aeruginascens]
MPTQYTKAPAANASYLDLSAEVANLSVRNASSSSRVQSSSSRHPGISKLDRAPSSAPRTAGVSKLDRAPSQAPRAVGVSKLDRPPSHIGRTGPPSVYKKNIGSVMGPNGSIDAKVRIPTQVGSTSRVPTQLSPIGDNTRTYVAGMQPISEAGLNTIGPQASALPSKVPISAKSILTDPEDIRMASRQTRFATLKPEEKKEQDRWAQRKIKQSGCCPAGFDWDRRPNGYQCNGGYHYMSDKLLAEGKGGVYQLTNSYDLESGDGPWYAAADGTGEFEKVNADGSVERLYGSYGVAPPNARSVLPGGGRASNIGAPLPAPSSGPSSSRIVPYIAWYNNTLNFECRITFYRTPNQPHTSDANLQKSVEKQLRESNQAINSTPVEDENAIRDADNMALVGVKRKRINPRVPAPSEKPSDAMQFIQTGQINVDPMGFEWISSPYPLDIDPALDFNLEDITSEFDEQLFSNLDQSYKFLSRDENTNHGVYAPLEFNLPSTKASERKGYSPVQGRNTPEIYGDNAEKCQKWQLLTCDDEFERRSKVTDTHSAGYCIRELSELSHSLYEHGTTIPPVSIHDRDPSQPALDFLAKNRPEDYSQYHLDKTYHLTQSLVDLYPVCIDLFARREIIEIQTTTPTEISGSQVRTVSRPKTAALSNFFALDHSSILLLLSCHIRLLEIYEELFKHMVLCLQQNCLALTPKHALVNSPKVQIGSFTPNKASSTQMQLQLLIQLTENLYHYAADLTRELRKYSFGDLGQADKHRLDLSVMTAESVEGRANKVMSQLGDVRQMMKRDGLITV